MGQAIIAPYMIASSYLSIFTLAPSFCSKFGHIIHSLVISEVPSWAIVVADAESVVDAALADYATATAMANNGTLYSSHAAAWSEVIWSSRVEFVGYATPCTLDV